MKRIFVQKSTSYNLRMNNLLDVPRPQTVRSVVAGGGQGGHGLPYFFEIVEFPEILMFCRKIFGLLLLIKIKGKKHVLVKRKFVWP